MPEKEVSYYEIALTSRQVLVTFIVALTCIALAFFAGVWVGQQDEGVAVAEVAASDDENDAPALGFFTEGEGDEEAAAEDPSAEVQPRAETPAGDTTQRRTADRESASQGTVAPSGSIILQVLASSNRTTAENTLTSLAEAGHSAYLQPVDRGDSTLYRVRVGPFADRAAAEAAKSRIDDAFNVEALITTEE